MIILDRIVYGKFFGGRISFIESDKEKPEMSHVYLRMENGRVQDFLFPDDMIPDLRRGQTLLMRYRRIGFLVEYSKYFDGQENLV